MKNADIGITPVHLHLELKDKYLDDYQKRMLRRYGESSTGDSISRDILIPSDMPLHNLHYAIQKLFGWHNSHLRRFILPDEIHHKLTGGIVKGWTNLVGDLFQPPSEHEYDIFWDDDYEKGDHGKWLKRKYTGPYRYGGKLEDTQEAKDDVQMLLDRFQLVETKEPFHIYLERHKKTGDEEIRTLRKAPLEELTIEEMNTAIMLEGGTEDLLERLEAATVLEDKDKVLDDKSLFPVTNELFYNYDFGDNWLVTITREDNFTYLVENGFISLSEIAYAADIVLDEHRPVCIHKDGVFILDDVGGLGGFANFLGTVYEGEDKAESREHLTWAKSLGWRDKKVGIKKML